MEQILEFLKPLIESFAAGNAGVAQVLAAVIWVIGTARLIIKPLRELVGVIVKLTKSEKDDLLVGEVEQSKWAKILVFLADYFFSVKLPPKKQ